MAEPAEKTVFRKKTLERISSPEQLTDYLCVTNPGIWVMLAAVILLLAGLFAWATVGTLETTADVKAVVENHTAEIIPLGAQTLTEGMPLRISGQDFTIAYVETDAFGRSVGTAEVALPDGTYDATVVTETTHPIRFLMESR